MYHHQVFESQLSHVWTGTLGTSLDAIENAEQNEMEAIPFSIQIWLKKEPKNASVAVQNPAQEGLYLVKTRKSDTPLQQMYSILLPRDALSCFSIYSPSPFVSTVLVVLDVNDKQQQGYFFGHVHRVMLRSTLGGKMQLSGANDNGTFDDTEGADELLDALHSAFPSVELSSSAKKCLAKQATRRRAPGKKLGEIMKRRKTLSADAFYGPTNAVKPTVVDPSTGRALDQNWQKLYEKLQFRVSRSMTCQLEGTAPISLSFPRQQEAFEFADQVAALRRRVKSTRGITSSIGYGNSECMPRVFSFESAGDGKRRFLVASFADFWKTYKRTRADQRHVYEIIREGVPCRLYLDLEFMRAINPRVDGDALVARLLSLLQLHFYRRYGIYVPHRDIYQLESSTPAKFSRHVIFHLPGGDLFTDNIHAGAFVRELINDLVVLTDDDLEKERPDQLYSPFLVNTESENDSVGKKQLFIDTGVYTRNRMFRVLGSSKFKKQAVLRLLNASSSSLTELDQGLFLNTLVCPYPDIEAVKLSQQTKPFRLLRCEPSPAVVGRSNRFTSSGAKILAASSVECHSSIYPVLDAFILSKATKGGVQGEIRAIQMLMTNSSDTFVGLPREGFHQEQPDMNTSSRPYAYPWMIIYHMTRNRWCANIRRQHKSNNVMFVVDIDRRVFYQKCHDPTCQSMGFRSPPKPLPLHIDFSAGQ